MCTLVFGLDPGGPRPVVAAANRDEALDRPAEPPRWRAFGDRAPVFAPRDLRAGGTWIGVSPRGVFAALTNRFGGPPATDRRSRGHLVAEALAHASAEAARRWADRLDPAAYDGFHLVVADRDRGFWVRADGRSLASDWWAPGVHVVTERAWAAAPSEREDWLREHLAQWTVDDLVFDRCRDLLLARPDRGLEGVLVRAPARNYGTRSSAVVELLAAPRRTRFAFTEGPPDRTPFASAELEA